MSDRVFRPATSTTAIGIRLPADLGQLTMLRALAETVALIGDFALDEATDIRVAVDEVATALILGAVPDGCVDIDFDFDDHRMSIRVAAVVRQDGRLDEHGFGWQILQALAEGITAHTSPFDAALGGCRTVVEFGRARGGN